MPVCVDEMAEEMTYLDHPAAANGCMAVFDLESIKVMNRLIDLG
jgi:hypothetical protein